MKKMNLAILGAGRIAVTMANIVSQMDEVNLYAVAARDGVRAKAFAEKYGVEKSYGSYEEMPHAHTLRVMELLDEIRARW
ncbi:MAG: Gfo/Idh/MocA family oxidoreductase [Clostridiales bacterium]|nr:Gfo/Idh/MocA family oxidoreductase [Clostridiales bacterium]